MHILIVEDNKVIRDTISKYVAQIPLVKTVTTATNSDEMFSILAQKNEINALILDIDLGDDSLDGITSYSLCKEYGYDLPAIIVTGNRVESTQTHSLGIVDVINKAHLYEIKKLKAAIEKLKLHSDWKMFKENQGICLPIQGEENLFVYPSEVLYIDSLNGDVYVHTTRREEPYPTQLKLNYYQDVLRGLNFFSPHRSFVVNSKFVRTVDGDVLELTNGDKILVSSARSELIQAKLSDTKPYSVTQKRTLLSSFIIFTKDILNKEKEVTSS